MARGACAAQSKEKLLTDLRKELQISNDEHYKVLSGVMADEEVTAIRTGVVLTAPTALATPQAPGGAALGPKRRKDGEERVPLGARCARCSDLALFCLSLPGSAACLPCVAHQVCYRRGSTGCALKRKPGEQRAWCAAWTASC